MHKAREGRHEGVKTDQFELCNSFIFLYSSHDQYFVTHSIGHPRPIIDVNKLSLREREKDYKVTLKYLCYITYVGKLCIIENKSIVDWVGSIQFLKDLRCNR